MRKIETIWHHLLYQALAEKQFQYTQQELAEKFSYSLSTVNHALKIPTRVGAIRKTSKFFILQDFEKLLFYWASARNLEKDIIYAARVSGSVGETESLIVPQAIPAAYSAARKILHEPPADYSKIYIYLPENLIEQTQQRFPGEERGEPNLMVLKMPMVMPNYGPVTTLPQTFVDIWGLRDWYARDFTQALLEKIHEILS